MNILNAIGSGLRNVGEGIGTGALAAGKGLADYLNAQAMRQSGLTPEQLQQNPQLARSAMGNWLGSIGQGMQTGDYTGSRLGYQQEMLTKLQNLQAMQRQKQFKEQAAQTDFGDQQSVMSLMRNNPEAIDSIAGMMKVPQAFSDMKASDAQVNRANAGARLDEAQASLIEYKKNHPEAQIKQLGQKVYAFHDDGSYKELFTLPPYVQVAGDKLFTVDGETVKQVGGGPSSVTKEQAESTNKALMAVFVTAGGKPDAFAPFAVSEGDALTALDDKRQLLGMAIQSIQAAANRAAGNAPTPFTYVTPDGTVGIAQPGQRLPPGAVSPTQFGSMSMPTAFTKTQVASADTVKQMAEKLKNDIEPLISSLGPAAGRWNELWTTEAGTKNPAFAKFKTNTTLLSSKLMNMHVGSRGGQEMMQHFNELIGQAKQDPANLQSTLDAIIEYADLVKSHGSSQPQGGDDYQFDFVPGKGVVKAGGKK
jgi:hypothetical protein